MGLVLPITIIGQINLEKMLGNNQMKPCLIDDANDNITYMSDFYIY